MRDWDKNKALALCANGLANNGHVQGTEGLVEWMRERGVITVLHIDWAATNLKDRSHIDLADQRLREAGFAVNLANIGNIREQVASANCIYINGGNPKTLAAHMRKTGLHDLLQQALKEGKTVVACSAGAIATGTGGFWLQSAFAEKPTHHRIPIKAVDGKGSGLHRHAVVPHVPNKFMTRMMVNTLLMRRATIIEDGDAILI